MNDVLAAASKVASAEKILITLKSQLLWKGRKGNNLVEIPDKYFLALYVGIALTIFKIIFIFRRISLSFFAKKKQQR